MKAKEKSKSTELAARLEHLDAWATQRAGAKFNPLDDCLNAYGGWEDLSCSFVDFIRTTTITSWTKFDCSIVENCISRDWGSHRLLRSLADEELFDLLTLPYPQQTVRMYMVVRSRYIQDHKLRESIAIHFFEQDISQAVRGEALCLLARGGWKSTEHHAKLWWDSGKVVNRMVTLNALDAAKSPLLAEYLDLAAKSSDKSLRSVASAMAATRKFSESET
jgi:hypothetical protein